MKDNAVLDWQEIKLRAKNSYGDWKQDINLAHDKIERAIYDIYTEFKLQNSEKINQLANEMVAENQ